MGISIGSHMSNVISGISALIMYGKKNKGQLSFSDIICLNHTVFETMLDTQKSILEVGKCVTEQQQAIILLLKDVNSKIYHEKLCYSEEFQEKVIELTKIYCPNLIK